MLPAPLVASESRGAGMVGSHGIFDELHLAISASVAPETLRKYQRRWDDLQVWLEGRDLTDLLLAEFLTELASVGNRVAAARCPERPLSPASCVMAVATVRFAYRLADVDCSAGPLTSRTLAGIRPQGRGLGPGQVDRLRYGKK